MKKGNSCYVWICEGNFLQKNGTRKWEPWAGIGIGDTRNEVHTIARNFFRDNYVDWVFVNRSLTCGRLSPRRVRFRKYTRVA